MFVVCLALAKTTRPTVTSTCKHHHAHEDVIALPFILGLIPFSSSPMPKPQDEPTRDCLWVSLASSLAPPHPARQPSPHPHTRTASWCV